MVVVYSTAIYHRCETRVEYSKMATECEYRQTRRPRCTNTLNKYTTTTFRDGGVDNGYIAIILGTQVLFLGYKRVNYTRIGPHKIIYTLWRLIKVSRGSVIAKQFAPTGTGAADLKDERLRTFQDVQILKFIATLFHHRFPLY